MEETYEDLLKQALQELENKQKEQPKDEEASSYNFDSFFEEEDEEENEKAFETSFNAEEVLESLLAQNNTEGSVEDLQNKITTNKQNLSIPNKENQPLLKQNAMSSQIEDITETLSELMFRIQALEFAIKPTSSNIEKTASAESKLNENQETKKETKQKGKLRSTLILFICCFLSFAIAFSVVYLVCKNMGVF